jgi:uncharacterized membrane protein
MQSPFSPIYLIFFLGFTLWLIFAIDLEIISLTFAKLGLSPHSALTLLLSSLFGSAINLPFLSLSGSPPPPSPPIRIPGLLRPSSQPFTGRTLIAVNVGGCLVPLFFSIYLFRNNPLEPLATLLAIATVTAVAYGSSRPVPGIGIGMPILVGPLAAALVAILLGGEQRAPLAYIAGTLGVLIGADLLRLRDVRDLGAPLASIGGAGTFDGIFMTGLVAVLLS